MRGRQRGGSAGAARGQRRAALSIRRMGRPGGAAAPRQCRPSATVVATTHGQVKRRSVGAAAAPWVRRRRMGGSSGAASVPPQRRGRGGGAWAGQAERRRCRRSAVGEAAAHGRVRWRSSAAPAPPQRAVARRWRRERPGGAETRRRRGGGARGRWSERQRCSRSQPRGRNPEQRRSSAADHSRPQSSVVDWRGGAGAAQSTAVGCSRSHLAAERRRAAQSGDIERRGGAGQRSRPQSSGERRRGRASQSG